MANICNNTLHGSCDNPEVLQAIVDFILNFDSSAQFEKPDACEIEAYFDSRWTFPGEEFTELADILKKFNDESLSITILSVEWSQYYAQFISWNGEEFIYE